MSENKRSFFATIPGLVTGLAGLLTGVVGLVTVLIQLGVIGDDDGSEGTNGATTTVVGGAAPGAGGATNTTEVPRFTVTPATLDFPSAGARTKPVKVSNESNATALTVLPAQVTGTDRAQFSVSSGTCNAPVRAGSSCELQVTFSPSGPLRNYQAALEVSAQGARAQEVRITGSSLLGG